MGSFSEWDHLPVKIRQGVRGKGIARLTQIREAISVDADLLMPPIRIAPYCWNSPHTGHIVYGCAHPVSVGQGYFMYGALFPAATLICVEDDSLLRRILCHEYCHCFYRYIVLFEAIQNGKESISFEERFAGGTPKARFENIVMDDKDMLANPAAWFGVGDAQDFLDETNHLFDEISKEIATRWILEGLPTKEFPIQYEENYWHIPLDIEERVKEILAKGHS